MDRVERCEEKFAEFFGGKPVTNEGKDPEFMRILQRFIFGEVCYTGSLDNRMRELITVTVLTVSSAAGIAHRGVSAYRRFACGDKGSRISMRAFCRVPQDAERNRRH